MASKKRNMWCDDHVAEMLAIIKEHHILKLLDNKTKRNKDIFENVAKRLAQKQIFKTAEQVKLKFKALKCDYYKVKRNNGTSGAQRQTSQYFELLDEMLSRRPVLTATGVDTSEDVAISNELNEILNSELDSEMTTEDEALTSTSHAATSSQYPTPNSVAHTLESALVSTPPNAFRTSKKNTYEKVVQKFTAEWTATQTNILSQMKKEDDEYLGKVADVLEVNRQETAKILDKDREETAKLFQNFFNNIRASQMQQPPPFSWTLPQCGNYSNTP